MHPPLIKLDWRGATREAIGSPLGLAEADFEQLSPRVAELHAQIAAERRLPNEEVMASLPGAKPLQYGFTTMPEWWLTAGRSELDRLLRTANSIAERSDIHVVLGIGGSYLGARALFEALCHRYHNELPRNRRNYRPRLHFEGNNVDGEAMNDLLDLLETGEGTRFSVHVISKSGGTLETAAAYHILRRWLRARYGEYFAKSIVATTDDDAGVLRRLSDQDGCDTFTVPDEIGGRFSVFTAVGLLPAAVVGIDVEALLSGARDFQAYCDARGTLEDNVAYQYAALMRLAEERGVTVRVLAAWSQRLEATGYWYDQLHAESLGKEGRGSTPLTIVGTRELHSRQQQHQEGPRDKIITNLWVKEPQRSLVLGELEGDPEGSQGVADKAYRDLSRAAREGANASLNADGRPTVELTLAHLDAYAMGQLLQFFMNATVMEARLMGVWPFGQPGVEAYKREMKRRLAEMPPTPTKDRKPAF